MQHNQQGWSEAAWQKHLPIYEKTQQLPFIQELITGRLNEDSFMFYIEQDALYLQAFTKLLRTMSDRMTESKFKWYFRDFFEENMAAEKGLHDSYLMRDLSSIVPTATCQQFIEFNEELATLPIELAVAGMLPCFIVYQQLGIYIYDQHIRDGNQYIDWIDMYAGIEHSESVRKLREICDHYGNQASDFIRTQMDEYYEEGCLWDQRFWQSCYEMK